MSKRTKVVYMTIFLFLTLTTLNGVINEYDFEVFYGYLKITLILSPILSIIIVFLWDYISKLMRDSQSTVWKVFKVIVTALSWMIVGLLIILLGMVFLVESDLLMHADTNFIWFVFALWGVISIVNAIKSFKKDS